MKILDLCAGTGSATKAFRDRGHDVETLDIIGNHTYVMDVREFVPDQAYDFVWASPPCTEFSIAKGIKCADRKPDLSIVNTCFEICKTAPYWILENPRGCLRHFVGRPTVTVNYSDYGYICKKPTDLWGIFPWFWSHVPHKGDVPLSHVYSGSQHALRGSVPYALSLAICKALENLPHSIS